MPCAPLLLTWHPHWLIVLNLIDSFIIHPNTTQKHELTLTYSSLPPQHPINHHIQNLSVLSFLSIPINHLYTHPNCHITHLSSLQYDPFGIHTSNLLKVIYLKFKSYHIILHLNTFKNYTPPIEFSFLCLAYKLLVPSIYLPIFTTPLLATSWVTLYD